MCVAGAPLSFPPLHDISRVGLCFCAVGRRCRRRRRSLTTVVTSKLFSWIPPVQSITSAVVTSRYTIPQQSSSCPSLFVSTSSGAPVRPSVPLESIIQRWRWEEVSCTAGQYIPSTLSWKACTPLVNRLCLRETYPESGGSRDW